MGKPLGLSISALTKAAAAGAPKCAGMFNDVQQSSATPQFAKTNPNPSKAQTALQNIVAGARPNAPKSRESSARESSGMFNNVQQSTANRQFEKTNPPQANQLTPRQIAAARLLVLGRSGRDVAHELKVEEHTISRWRRHPAFAAELKRQDYVAMAMQVGDPRRREKSTVESQTLSRTTA